MIMLKTATSLLNQNKIKINNIYDTLNDCARWTSKSGKPGTNDAQLYSVL